jgi:hypothetical protein
MSGLSTVAYVRVVVAGPEGGFFVGSVPGKAEVYVVCVRIGTCVCRPGAGVSIRTPDLFVPDHIHNPKSPCHRVFVTLTVGCKQPVQE